MKQPKRRKPDLTSRLHAWWEGIELPPEAPGAPKGAAAIPPPRATRTPHATPTLGTQAPAQPNLLPDEPPLLLTKRVYEDEPEDGSWTGERLAASELIWGQDFTQPGGEDLFLAFARPFGQIKAKNLLQLGAGVGGGTRALADQLGCWVTGLEADPLLAHDGHDRSVQMGMEARAPVRAYDPDRFELRARSFDYVFARESFHTIADRPRLFQALHVGLKPAGEMVFTDFLLSGGTPSEALSIWLGGHLPEPKPGGIPDTESTLKRTGFDIRRAEDVTATYRTQLTASWDAATQHIRSSPLSRAALRPVIAECERWQRLVGAIDGGDLVVARFHVTKPESD